MIPDSRRKARDERATVSTMTVEISVNVTADRMRSVLRSVSLMTSNLRMTVQLQSVTVTLWSRYV